MAPCTIEIAGARTRNLRSRHRSVSVLETTFELVANSTSTARIDVEEPLAIRIHVAGASPSNNCETVCSSSAPAPTLRQYTTPSVGSSSDTTTVSVQWRKHDKSDCGLRYHPNYIPSYIRVSAIPDNEITIAPPLYPPPMDIDEEQRDEEDEDEEMETEMEREPLEYGELTIKGLTLSPILSRLPERRDLPSIRSIFPDIFPPSPICPQPYDRPAQMARYLEEFERRHEPGIAPHRIHAAHQS